MSSLKEKIDTLNSMIQQGAVLDAFEKFYAENVTMQENEDAPTVGKANNRVNEEAFVGGIVEFRKADIKNISKIKIRLPSNVGHPFISLLKNLLTFKIFLLTKKTTTENKTSKAKISKMFIIVL